MALETWKEVGRGGLITKAGNSEEYETGGWRAQRPMLDAAKCSSCLICWVYCPDGSILVKDGKFAGFDLAHCKGCGICAEECPRKAIEMKDEIALLKEGAA